LAPRFSPRPHLLAPHQRLLAVALALQEAVIPLAVGRNLGGLRLEPALMVAEIFLGGNQDLA
jgi:hypothetical protein